MPWPKFLRRNMEPSTTPADRPTTEIIELELAGWVEGEESGGLRGWRDQDGDLLTLHTNVGSVLMGPINNERARRTAREIAENGSGGLIEAEQGQCHAGRTVTLIYKRLLRPAYVYTGMLIVIRAGLDDLVWTVVAGEHGMTGVREAVITAELMNAGALTIESYQQSWAQDPYEQDYTGVDRSVLRFMSDDKKYDERFPTHPLSKVRSVLSSLPNHFRVA